ncbi:MAG: acyl-CoA dehydrogenase family protein [Mycobacteriales bacterium]
MDFSLSPDQQEVRELAARVFAAGGPVDAGVDLALWRRLAAAGLVGLALPEDVGGGGLGVLEACLVLEEQGRRVAPVPLWSTVFLGALPLARFGTAEQRAAFLPGVCSGEALLTAAIAGVSPGGVSPVAAAAHPGGWTLSGRLAAVPAADQALRVLVPAALQMGGAAVFLVDPRAPGVTCHPALTTHGESRPLLELDSVAVSAADCVGAPGQGEEVLAWTRQRALVGLAAMQVGVAEEAVRLAAAYTSTRQQFGRPLAGFQGVALRAADAYIDTEAIRVTMLAAAWLLATDRPADREVAVAKWWAADAGHRIVHAVAHLFGGIGSDISYPVHRYFLWGKQLELELGGADEQLARLGALVVAGGVPG